MTDKKSTHPLFKLTPTQKKHYETVRWLYMDGPKVLRNGREHPPVEKNRQTGRSTLLMAVLLEIAMERRGAWVRVCDPYSLDNDVSRSVDETSYLNLKRCLQTGMVGGTQAPKLLDLTFEFNDHRRAFRCMSQAER